jgi:4-hydroxy 2-oxovalerate aldolase
MQLGESMLPDLEMLTVAKNQLKKTQIGAFLIPGYGTIRDDISPAIDLGINVLMVACHCTEANITRQHLVYAKSRNVTTYGVLMMSHMILAPELLEQAKLMESYGVTGVLLMDSAGAYLPDDVAAKVGLLSNNLHCAVGFHAHNNLGMAIANSVKAVEAGATLIDCTSRGIGAGAGNCQLEVIVSVLERMGYHTGLDIYALMDSADKIIAPVMTKPLEINGVTLTSGLAGVFSGFAPHAIRAANQFGVDVRDILLELGKRKVVGGQEDIIIDVAMNLKQKKEKQAEDFQIASLL